MLRRWLFLSTLTLSILVASLFYSSSNVMAWDGDLPTCTDIPDYTSALQSQPEYDADKTAFVVFKRGWSGPPFNGNPAVAIDWDITTDTGGGNHLYFSGSPSNTGNTLNVNIPPAMIINPDGSLTPPSMNTIAGFSDINCISAVHNADYDSTYTGKTDYPDPVSGTTIDAPPSEPCDWWDLVCVTQKIYLSITGFFSTFATDLNATITDIFGPMLESLIPGEDNATIFSDFYTSLKANMETKLGFLTYPFAFFADFISTISTAGWTGGFSPSCTSSQDGFGVWGLCTLSFEMWQGQSVHIDFGFMEKNFPALWSVSITLVRFAFFLAIVEMLRRAYFRTVKA